MKKIIINVIIAIASLVVMYALLFGDFAFIREIGTFGYFDTALIALITFATSGYNIVYHLDYEEV